MNDNIEFGGVSLAEFAMTTLRRMLITQAVLQQVAKTIPPDLVREIVREVAQDIQEALGSDLTGLGFTPGNIRSELDRIALLMLDKSEEAQQ